MGKSVKQLVTASICLSIVIPAIAVDGYVAAGQSNMVGQYGNPQPPGHAYSGPSLLFGNDYVIHNPLYDPTDDPTGQIDTVSLDNSVGSFIPNTVTNLDAHGVTSGWVPCAKDGSTISDWQPGANHQDRTTLYGSMVYRTLQAGTNWNMKCCCFWQGENNILNGTPTNTWVAGMFTLSDSYFADTGLPTMLCIMQTLGPGINATTNAMYQTAMKGIIGTHHIIQGPDLSDLTTAPDEFHFINDTQAVLVGNRWAAAIISDFYAGHLYTPAPFRR